MVVKLFEQAHQDCRSFLLLVEHLQQIGLGLLEFGLFGLLRSAIFVQRSLYLRCGSVRINCFLQGISVGIGLAKLAATTTAIVTATATIAATTTKSAGHRFTSSVHYLLYERLDSVPIGIVRKAKLFSGAVQHALLHRGRIKITAAESSATATAATATTAATTVVLSPKTIRTHTQSRGHRQHRKQFIHTVLFL